MEQISRLLDLYTSNSRSIGKFDPKNGKMYTEYRSLSAEDFELHLAGRVGVGAVPILDDGTCKWAAIDIDNHDQEDDIPIAPIDEYITANKLPLIPCRSKSGGVHVYLFLSEAIRADRIRDIMNMWAAELGYAGSEVFPKQVKLNVGTKMILGNWINLPYMNAGQTERYAVKAGKRLSLDEFLDAAERSRCGHAELMALRVAQHADAPPCIQQMIMHGVERGRRNEAMYNTVVYLRKVDGDSYSTKAAEMNRHLFEHPLGKSELSRVITSAGKDQYNYRCGEEPIRSLCNRAVCLKRKYGITEKDIQRIDANGALPVFTDLIQIDTDPPRWEVMMDGRYKVTNLSTMDLLDFSRMRAVIIERLLKVVPKIAPQEWERVLAELMESARKIEAPDDASPGGIIRERLRDFVGRIDIRGSGLDTESRKALYRGLPVMQMYEGERVIMFRGADFMAYLKRHKAEVLRDINLWIALRRIGATHQKLRVGEKSINVWCVPAAAFEPDDIEPPEMVTEL